MDLDTRNAAPYATPQAVDLPSETWFSPINKVIQTTTASRSSSSTGFECENNASSLKSAMSLRVDGADTNSKPQWKVDDLKSWLWLQQAIHPEVNYELPFRKRLFPTKTRWKELSLKKWLKELKQERKEKLRLHRAEVHAALSVAGVAAALAAIAAENTSLSNSKPSKDSAVATAAAVVAAQCAQMAEAIGANPDQLASAINAAVADTDASNIITLTAAAATSMRGAATLRQRPGHVKKIKGKAETILPNNFDFDLRKCRASLAKGDEFLMETQEGWKLRWVSIVYHKDAKVILRTKKISLLMVLSKAKESIVYDLLTAAEESIQDTDVAYVTEIKTSHGKIKLRFNDYICYKKWVLTINHMLMHSTTIGKY